MFLPGHPQLPSSIGQLHNCPLCLTSGEIAQTRDCVCLCAPLRIQVQSSCLHLDTVRPWEKSFGPGRAVCSLKGTQLTQTFFSFPSKHQHHHLLLPAALYLRV